MSTSHGTGQPLFLKCQKCRQRLSRRLPYERLVSNRQGTNLVATGRTKKLTGQARSNGGSRVLGYSAEYRCLDCGHVGWSRHVGMERLLRLRDQPTEGTP